MMDERKERIGAHAPVSGLPWAVSALGPVPEGPAERRDWQRRAASIGAYRELSGYDRHGDPIGPEPAAVVPDLRAAWHETLAALAPAGGPDVRGMPEGTLLHLRDTYPIETAWAPQWTGDELRQVRVGAGEARLAAIRADAEASVARRQGRAEQASQQEVLAASYQAMDDAYQEREAVFAAVTANRADWDRAQPNPSPSPKPSAKSSPSPQRSRSATLASGSGNWSGGAANSPAGSPSGRACCSPPKIPTLKTSARRFPRGQARAGTRSSSRPGPRSGRPRGYSNAPLATTWTSKPPTDGASRCHAERGGGA
jgi:hypothetical protein